MGFIFEMISQAIQEIAQNQEEEIQQEQVQSATLTKKELNAQV